MTNDLKFNEARASLKDLAKKVESIDLSGSGLVGGKKPKKVTKKKAASPGKSRSRSTKKRSGSAKSRSTSAKKRSGSAKKKSTTASKKTSMNVNEHKLADNLI